MRLTRFLQAAFTGSALTLVVACGDSARLAAPPSEPSSTEAELFGEDLGQTSKKDILSAVLLQCTPLAYDSVTQLVGPGGGVIQVGVHRLSIPAGALDASVAITAVQRPDTVNVLHFDPDGLQFDKKARLTMSYANCNLLGSLLPKSIAYVSPSFDILDLLSSSDNLLQQQVTAKLKHFSDYAVAW